MNQVPMDEPPDLHLGLNKIIQEVGEKIAQTDNKGMTANIIEKGTMLYGMYTIIEEITKIHIWHISYYILQLLLPVLQFIGVHFWYAFVYNKGIEAGPMQFINVMNLFMSFSFGADPENLETSTIATGFVFLFVSILVIFVILMIVKNSGHCSRALAIITAVIVQIIMYSFTIPVGYLFGKSLNGIFDSNKTSITVFFFSILLIIVVMYFDSVSTATINYMTNPSQSIFTTFTGQHTMAFFTINLILAAFGQCGKVFPSWFSLFLLCVSILAHGYLFYDVFNFPFATISGNAIAGGGYLFAIFADFLTLLVVAGVKVPGMALIIVPFAILLVTAITLYFVMRYKVNQVTNLVTLNESQNPIDVYDEMNLENENLALYYVRVGFMGNSVSVLNGAFPLYIADLFNSFKTSIFAAEILAFVPGEHDAFLKAHSRLKSIYAKSTIEKIKALRIMQIEQVRYSTDDLQSVQTFTKLKNSTTEIIAAIRQFWSDVSTGRQVMINEVDGIGNYIKELNKEWNETLEIYPNDPKFAELYSTYNIEGTGKFEKGVYWLVKSSHLESGLHGGTDMLFRAFVISRPEVLHRNIVDKYGNVAIAMDGDAAVSMTTTTKTADAEEKFEEEIDGGIIERKSAELFLWPKLRMTVTNITSNYKPPYFVMMIILRIVAVIGLIICLILIITTFKVSFDTTDFNAGQISSLVNMVEALSYTFSTLLLRAANKTGQLFTTDAYKNYFPASAINEPYYAMHYDNINKDREHWSQTGVIEFLNFFRRFSKAADIGVDASQLIEDVREVSYNKTYCRGAYSRENDKRGIVGISTKNAIVSTFWNQFIVSDDELAEYESNAQICESNLGSRTLQLNIRDIAQRLADDVQVINKVSQKNNSIIIYIYIGIFFVALGLSIAPNINLYLAETRIFKSLLSVNSASAIEGSHPIITKSEEEKTHSNIQKQTNSYKTRSIVYLSMSAIFLLVVFVLPIIAYNTTKKNVSAVSEVLPIAHYGSERMGYVEHLFNLVTIQILGEKARKVIDPVDDRGRKSHWDKNVIRKEFDLTVEELQRANRLFLHGKNNDGMISRLEEVKNLHVDDQCTNQVVTSAHDFYYCLGIDRSLSSFILYATDIMDLFNQTDPKMTFSNGSFMDLHHLASSHLASKLKQSREITLNYIQGTINNSDAMVIAYVVLTIISIIISEIFLFLYGDLQKRTIKALLVIIRHLPPPVIAETKEIITALSLTEANKKEDDLDPLEVVFNGISTPVLCIGDNSVIEATNKPFLEAFEVTINDIVGRRINSIIQVPNPNEQEITVEEQGAQHLLEKMHLMENEVEVQNCSYRVNLTLSNEIPIPVQMTTVPIKNAAGKVNFVIDVEDTRRFLQVQNELNLLEKQAEILLNQLIPRTIASFVSGREKNFAFIAKTSTVVAIRITGAFEMIQHSYELLDTVILQLDSIANRNPPFMPIKSIYDTMFYIGGLFTTNDKAAPAIAAIKFALEAKAYLEETLQKGDDNARFYISVLTGGPLLGGLVGNVQVSFEVTGPLIDETATLLESAPPDTIIVSETTKVDAEEGDTTGIQFDHKGTQALGMATYLF